MTRGSSALRALFPLFLVVSASAAVLRWRTALPEVVPRTIMVAAERGTGLDSLDERLAEASRGCN